MPECFLRVQVEIFGLSQAGNRNMNYYYAALFGVLRFSKSDRNDDAPLICICAELNGQMSVVSEFLTILVSGLINETAFTFLCGQGK